jgi:hypothetical protein
MTDKPMVTIPGNVAHVKSPVYDPDGRQLTYGEIEHFINTQARSIRDRCEENRKLREVLHAELGTSRRVSDGQITVWVRADGKWVNTGSNVWNLVCDELEMHGTKRIKDGTWKGGDA